MAKLTLEKRSDFSLSNGADLIMIKRTDDILGGHNYIVLAQFGAEFVVWVAWGDGILSCANGNYFNDIESAFERFRTRK